MSHQYNGPLTDDYNVTNITVTQSFSNDNTLDSITVTHPTVTLGAAEVVATITSGGDFEGREFKKELANGVLYVDAYTDATSGSDTDYMAGGLWWYVPDDADIQKTEIGAFAYASSLADRNSIGSLSGATLTFTGETAGSFSGQDAQGEFEAGYFGGDVSLTANFDTDMISGEVTNIQSYWYNEQGFLEVTSQDLKIILSEANFSSYDSGSAGGYFHNETNSIGTDHDSATLSGGKWGGLFTSSTSSSFSDASGISGVIGTYGGKINYTDTSWYNFVGVYGATKD